MGVAGLALLMVLVVTSAAAMATIPVGTLEQWNNPTYWSGYPKSAYPSWFNSLLGTSLPEHLILNQPALEVEQMGSVRVTRHTYTFRFDYGDFPEEFVFKYAVRYRGPPPLVELSAIRPDRVSLLLIKSTAAPMPEGVSSYVFNGTVYSTDRLVKSNVAQSIGTVTGITVNTGEVSPQVAIFSKLPAGEALGAPTLLRGDYSFNATFYTFHDEDAVLPSELIVGGKVYGLLGTDDLRRDLFVGVVWGTPVALLIGLTVAMLSVFVGVLYGVVSGYRGKRVDEAMMRLNDVVYALPALPFLIILTVALGRNIILVVFYLVIFGWVGVAKVARSIALQVKTLPYVEAAKLVGASEMRVMLRHVMPQIAPYALASIALSVPSAILTEAALSFLGLGDPTLPTWGQILHDAQIYGAAARGMWWWIMPPGIMIAVTGLTFVLIGTALDAVLNPKMRRV